MIYLDSSALLKLLIEESESAALASWVSERAAIPVMSSELAKLEVLRAVRRIEPTAMPAARALVSQLDLIPLSGAVIDQAVEIGEPLFRSLDAIHLASALSIGESLTSFVVYDHRLAAAALAAGLPIVRPGT